ncbi:MAG: hypothetical protein M3068_14340 [Gemmatimonadota bacterium]|nr:hypothetical protein [Gemmatimonadota bacterium]
MSALGTVLMSGWLLGLLFRSPPDRRAIWVSAAVAYGVQLLSWAILQISASYNLFAGRGIGVLLRLATLAVYALAIVKAHGLPATAALISLAVFLFLCTLVESLLLPT